MTGLYIHVPFCARACPYCDFDFEVGRRPRTEAYLEGLQAEVDARGIEPGTTVQTVYVGGGTPTMLGPQGLAALTAWVDHTFDGSVAVERTVEANPEHLDETTVAAIVEAGFDRVSIGMQSFNPSGLVQLGRVHEPEAGRAAARRCIEAGLRTSVDLIVGWPGQSPRALARDLDEIAAIGVGHVSVYALTIEPGTPWERLAQRGSRGLPDPQLQADALQQCEVALSRSGFVHYEVASYGRGSDRSRHNSLYWTWEDYLGLGPSAASARFDPTGAVHRATNPRGLDRWRSDPTTGEAETLAPQPAAVEGLWTGLRLLEGLDVARYLRRFAAVDRAWLEQRVQGELERGNLQWSDDGSRLRVAPGRWLFHDEICASLM